MSDAAPRAFKRIYSSSDIPPGQAPSSRTQIRKFSLIEKVDPEQTGQTSFTYDSEKARNFDETNVKRAREGASEILRDAINKAKTKAAQIREEASKLGYDEGFKEGFSTGEKQAREEFAPLLQTIHELIEQLSRFRSQMYPKVEREMVEMVVALAQKVIHHELTVREDSIQDMILLGMQSVLDKESMVIKLNPADKGYAESFRPELHQLFEEIKNITFETTPAIERGGCIIKSNFGTIDARLENLAEQIEKILNLAPVSFLDEPAETPPPESESPSQEP
ncbi:MAG: FliH/SctL family protein [Nitrospinales bacterium]